MPQEFGPDNATLRIRTGRTGGAAKAGHDLVIELDSWQASFDPDAQPAMTLTADSRSCRVVEGSGGLKSLTESDKADIKKTIDKDVLKGCAITFRSTAVEPIADGSRVKVEGELELGGKRRPVGFEVTTQGGRLTGSATVKQTEFGIKPYSALFGALKVADEVQVEVDADVNQASL
jgi:polyisoprenoid-binding protein YceI